MKFWSVLLGFLVATNMMVPHDAQTLVYGKSGSGNFDLTAYRIGTGENVLLMTFCLHGFDDAFARDGRALTELGQQLRVSLEGKSDWVSRQNWSVYLVPCANPDGLYLGSGTYGPGRCTTTSDDGKGMDLNRCFDYDFSPFSDSRNYNGTAPLQCTEARALAKLAQDIRSSGRNVCLDIHGWYAQVLTDDGENWLYNILHAQLPACDYKSLRAGSGYFSAWCGYELGYDACLLELPPVVAEGDEITATYLPDALEQAVTEILQYAS